MQVKFDSVRCAPFQSTKMEISPYSDPSLEFAKFQTETPFALARSNYSWALAPIKLFYPISVVKISHGFAATIVYMSDGGKLEVNSYAIIMFWCFYQTTAITGVDTEKEIMELPA